MPAGFGLGILARQFPVCFHLGEQGSGFFRRVHDPRPVNIPPRDAPRRDCQQLQDFIPFGAAGRVASPSEDAKLFPGKPVRQGDGTCRRVRCQHPLARVFPVKASVKANRNPPCLFVPSGRECGHVP